MGEGSEKSGKLIKRIPTAEAGGLTGAVVLRGRETPAEFEGTIVQWANFITRDEQDFLENAPPPDFSSLSEEEQKNRLMEYILSPYSGLESQVAKRIFERMSQLPQNAILVARDGADVTYYAHLATGRPLPFICIVSPGGLSAHGNQVLQETYETSYRNIPPNFLAVGRVERCRELNQGDRVKITIVGQRVNIIKVSGADNPSHSES